MYARVDWSWCQRLHSLSPLGAALASSINRAHFGRIEGALTVISVVVMRSNIDDIAFGRAEGVLRVQFVRFSFGVLSNRFLRSCHRFDVD